MPYYLKYLLFKIPEFSLKMIHIITCFVISLDIKIQNTHVDLHKSSNLCEMLRFLFLEKDIDWYRWHSEGMCTIRYVSANDF